MNFYKFGETVFRITETCHEMENAGEIVVDNFADPYRNELWSLILGWAEQFERELDYIGDYALNVWGFARGKLLEVYGRNN